MHYHEHDNNKPLFCCFGIKGSDWYILRSSAVSQLSSTSVFSINVRHVYNGVIHLHYIHIYVISTSEGSNPKRLYDYRYASPDIGCSEMNCIIRYLHIYVYCMSRREWNLNLNYIGHIVSRL
jgi:hypothetical protein